MTEDAEDGLDGLLGAVFDGAGVARYLVVPTIRALLRKGMLSPGDVERIVADAERMIRTDVEVGNARPDGPAMTAARRAISDLRALL